MRHNRKYRPSAFRTYEEWAIRARERRTQVTVEEFRVSVIKDRLTLWFYCVKEGCSEARNRWRAAQINGFCWDAHCCALQRCRVPIPHA